MNTAMATYVSADTEEMLSRESVADWRLLLDDRVIASGEDAADKRPVAVPGSVSVLYPLTMLGDRELAQSLVVVVESEEKGVVMSSPKLRMWGIGADVYEALSDFSATFFDVYESYRQTPEEQLTPAAVQYLRQLESYVPE